MTLHIIFLGGVKQPIVLKIFHINCRAVKLTHLCVKLLICFSQNYVFKQSDHYIFKTTQRIMKKFIQNILGIKNYCLIKGFFITKTFFYKQ